MNKQEAIEKIEKRKSNFNAWEDLVRNRAFEDALTIVRKIDEPEKPVVPQYVADWIEWCKNNNVTLLGAMSPIDELGTAICDDKKVESLEASKWATRNQETFAQAWLFGYEVKKEKLYTVELPNQNGGTHLVLCRDCDGKLFVETFLIDDWETFGKCKLTEAEIKKEFSWAWQFAKEWKDEDREEKLYTVELPSPNCPTDDHYILSRLKNGKIIINRYCIEQWKKFGGCQLTESEIKQDFDWAWQFAKEVKE